MLLLSGHDTAVVNAGQKSLGGSGRKNDSPAPTAYNESATQPASGQCGTAARHEGRDPGSDGGERCADHATANVRSEAFARPAQVSRKHARQVVPPETELCHRQKAGGKDSPLQQMQVIACRKEIDQRNDH
jgi:hypothetical protein